MQIVKAFALPLACAVLAATAASFLFMGSARADTIAINATAFPLPGNALFPARNNRLALKCANYTTNNAVTITYASGFSFIMVPGASLWETNRPPQGAITATGTAGQQINCEDIYQ